MGKKELALNALKNHVGTKAMQAAISLDIDEDILAGLVGKEADEVRHLWEIIWADASNVLTDPVIEKRKQRIIKKIVKAKSPMTFWKSAETAMGNLQNAIVRMRNSNVPITREELERLTSPISQALSQWKVQSQHLTKMLEKNLNNKSLEELEALNSDLTK